jgi:azurin
MKLRTLLIQTTVVALITLLTLPVQAQKSNKNLTPDRVIEMEGTDDLKFTVENINAKPGQVIRVKLKTVSDYPKQAMAHNLVLLSLDANAEKVATKSAQAYENNYIAPNMDEAILAHTGLAGDGETVSVTFEVPQKPGDYPYICSFPGHFSSGMKGTLSVSAGKASL